MMKFTIVVQGAPYISEASHSALHFARAVLAGGHEIYRVFFYNDGVLNGNTAIVAPQDEPNIGLAWTEFAVNENVELVVCIASSLRRGLLDTTEASRYEKSAANLDKSIVISGLGQLIDGTLVADRTITFGA